MPPIDPSIALGFKQPQIQDPVAATMRAQEVGVNALKMQELQRGIQEEQDVRNFLRGADLTKPETRAQLSQFGKTGLGYGKLLTEQETSRLQAKKLGGEISKQDYDDFKKRTADLSFNPSDENVLAHLQDGILRNQTTRAAAEQQWAQISKMNPEQRKQYFTNMAVDVSKRFEMENISAAQQQTADIAREGQKLTYTAATQPVFSETSGGFYTRPTGGNAAEFIPASGTDMTTKGKSVNIAKQNVTTLASEMAQGYKNLLDKKAIKSTEAGAASNLSASSQSSMAGQILGGVFGTEEQDIRDYIKSQRPLLVQAIVKATGMSAQQINSNAELKNMLDAATDPGRGYESNIRALNGLNTMFGTGTPILPSAPVTPALAPAAKPTLESIFAPAKK